MERRDVLLDEIERMNRFLAKVLGRLLGTDGGNDNQLIDLAEEQLKEELNLDLPILIMLSNEEFITALNKNKTLKKDHLEKLGDIIFEIGQRKYSEQKNSYTEKALFIYEKILFNSKNYEVDLANKIDRIKNANHVG